MNGAADYRTLAQGRVGLLELRRAEPETLRVVCFPFGGGGGHAFRGLAAHLPSTWSVWGVDPPGHVYTAGAPLHTVEEMCALFLEHLPTHILEGSLLLGHSVGGFVALKLAEQLEQHAGPCAGVVVGATPPPSLIAPGYPLSSMNDDQLFAWSMRLDEESADDLATRRELFDVFAPAIRADIRAYEQFKESSVTLTSAPLLVVGGTSDWACPPAYVRAWRGVRPDARVRVIAGAHLFVLGNPSALASAICCFVHQECSSLTASQDLRPDAAERSPR